MTHDDERVVGPILFKRDELPGYLGQEFIGEWMAIEYERIAEFDSSTYVVDEDLNFTLEDYPDGMLEGLHTLGLLPQLLDTAFRLEDPDTYPLVYGFNRIRYLTRVFAGQRMRVRGVVREVTPRQDGYVTLLDCTVELEDSPKPAYVAEWLVLWLPTKASQERQAASA